MDWSQSQFVRGCYAHPSLGKHSPAHCPPQTCVSLLSYRGQPSMLSIGVSDYVQALKSATGKRWQVQSLRLCSLQAKRRTPPSIPASSSPCKLASMLLHKWLTQHSLLGSAEFETDSSRHPECVTPQLLYLSGKTRYVTVNKLHILFLRHCHSG